ncbi:MAG TPA: ABC transporter ATP-binding protein [Gemmatimonadales bacterium]|nr:ABC transporter ATP-binding protein [Gemmatimonadales bacterium]
MILGGTELSVRYPGAASRALDRVSCVVEPGRLLAVVGPNGSGKSTLLRALLGLAPMESGAVTLKGRPLSAWPRATIATLVGVVSQREEILFPLDVEATVLMARYARLGPLAAAGPADREAVRSALERCDAWSLRARRTETLSGGEWQRVRVARALAQEPEALLLDEPTVALDVRHEMEVFELVRGLANRGLGALVVTHHLNLAARYADGLLLLDQGRLVAQGTAAEVFREEILSSVFRWPVAVTPWRGGAPQLVPLRPGEAVT